MSGKRGIIEKLRIKPLKAYYGEQSRPYCNEKEVRELEQQRNELLEALIYRTLETEKHQLKYSKEWNRNIEIIEKVTGKTWEEIQEPIK